jgi:hypothetical protein
MSDNHCNDLVDRLRGIYRIPVNDGAGKLGGKDYFERKFDASNLPAIHAEAANEIERLRKLEVVVVRVLTQQGDDHCWRDVYTEMAGLVGMEFLPVVLDKPTMIRNCDHFVDCLLSGDHYVAPSVAETEKLRAQVAELKRESELHLDCMADCCDRASKFLRRIKELEAENATVRTQVAELVTANAELMDELSTMDSEVGE